MNFLVKAIHRSATLNLKRTLAFAVVVPLLLMTALSGLFLWQIRHLLDTSRSVARSDQVIAQARNVEKLLVDMETGMRGYLYLLEPVFLGPYTRARAEIEPQWSVLEDLVKDNPSQLKRVQESRVVAQAWMSNAAFRIGNAKTRQSKEELLSRAMRGKDLMDSLRADFRVILDDQTRIRDERRLATEQTTRWTLGSGLGIALIWGLMIALWTRRQIVGIASTYEKALGDLAGAQKALHEINEQLEVKVQERTVALTSSNAELEAFCYSVSHDLRAPLRGIDGFSQALLEDYGNVLDAQGKQYLKFVREGIQQMGKLIDDLLNLSRLTRIEMRKESFDLSEVARIIGERLRRENPDRTVHFTAQPGIQVEGDRGLLEAVIENLLANAWKFTAKKPDARIEFGQKETPEGRVLFVKDNGAGFDMAYISKLFGAFQRLHSPNEFKGTGVGLATVRRVIHRHGGRIWAEATVGQGASFYFTL
jgi:signal transduction histidine kinase